MTKLQFLSIITVASFAIFNSFGMQDYRGIKVNKPEEVTHSEGTVTIFTGTNYAGTRLQASELITPKGKRIFTAWMQKKGSDEETMYLDEDAEGIFLNLRYYYKNPDKVKPFESKTI